MGSLDNGWIKLHRKITNNWIWDDPEKLRAWLDILLMVNHEDRQIPYNGHIITIKAGQKLTSLSKLAERWGWSRNRVDRFLRLLDEAEMVTANRTPNGTVLTVVKWGFFQDRRDTNEATVGATVGATNEATVGAQTRMIKNYKEGKEVYMAEATHTVPPTLEEVRAYCEKRDNGIDPEQFVDYYAMRNWTLSRGQPMTDWKASVRYWERNHKQKDVERHPDNHPDQRKDYWDVFDDLEETT